MNIKDQSKSTLLSTIENICVVVYEIMIIGLKTSVDLFNPDVIDKIIRHLKLSFIAEDPPPPHNLHQELLMAAEEHGDAIQVSATGNVIAHKAITVVGDPLVAQQFSSSRRFIGLVADKKAGVFDNLPTDDLS